MIFKRCLLALVGMGIFIGCSSSPEETKREEMFRNGVGLPEWMTKPIHTLDYRRQCQYNICRDICMYRKLHPNDYKFVSLEDQDMLLNMYHKNGEVLVKK